MVVSADAPYLDMAYKLVRYGERDVLKLSVGKVTWTGPKQVYRFTGAAGRSEGDLIATADDPPPSPAAVPLLRTVMRAGTAVEPHPPLTSIRDHCTAQVDALPESVRRLHDAERYPTRCSDTLVSRQRKTEAEVSAAEGVEPREGRGGR